MSGCSEQLPLALGAEAVPAGPARLAPTVAERVSVSPASHEPTIRSLGEGTERADLRNVSPASIPPVRTPSLVLAICFALAAAVWAVFGQTLRHDFVNYDDVAYVTENPIVQKGLTWEGVRWALTFGEIGHWHPLTWISHMLDCQLFGLDAGGHHLTSVMFHAATAVLLFLVLRQMTGYLWRSAFVAAAFAIHPLRAESVAWVSERKDVLAGFFFVLTLGAYARYAQRPSLARYAAVLLAFALGLLCKNTLVTLPFVLLLLDYWPLRRTAPTSGPQRWRSLVEEKVPLLMLTIASCIATALVPETVPDIHRWSFAVRLENAVLSYVTYLGQAIYPAGLACCYPGPSGPLSLGKVVGALLLLLGFSGAAFATRKRYPCLTVGWLWYLGMLVPAIGLVQISYYAHADRYTYLPQIGLFFALTWLAADLSAGWPMRRWVLGGMAAIILPVLVMAARLQASYWRNTETLWAHALACNPANDVAHFDLGTYLLDRGRVDEAIGHLRQAVALAPNDDEFHGNLGVALSKKGRVDEAALQYEEVLRIKPDDPIAHQNLGNILLGQGKSGEALVHFQKAVASRPTYVEAWVNLGSACLQQGRAKEAVAHFRRALAIDPKNVDAQNNLAWALATSPDVGLRDGAQAVMLAEQVNRRTGAKDPNLLDTLAAAYAEDGRFTDAVSCVRTAIELAQASGQRALLAQLEAKRQLYAAGHPFREERK